MFFDEKFTHPHLKKSKILNLIGFFNAMGFSIALFIIPLYLLKIFQSGEVIGQINAMAGGVSVITTLLLSLLLQRFSRGTLFKFSVFTTLLGLILFLFISKFHEALGARSLLIIGGTIVGSILSLYLKDLSEKEVLGKNQGIFQTFTNTAWLIGPIGAGFLFNFFKENKNFIHAKFNFLGGLEYFEYNLIFYIAIFFTFSSFAIFLWAKFVNKHPHLQKTKNTEKNNKHHHFVNLKFIGEYFNNKYRTLSFLNITFLTIWYSTIWGFGFSILLKGAGLDEQKIGLFIGLLALPLATCEGFLDKLIKKFKTSINVLILGYGIFLFFLGASFLVGYSNIYIFIFLFILAHIGVAIAEVLQQYQYFEGTKTEEDEAKFYSIHMLGGAISRIIAPIAFGSLIAIFGIQKAFYFVPVLILLFFIGLIIYKTKFENKNIKIKILK